MAKWRIESDGNGRWWLMSGTNTLGKINGHRTAQQIVRDHNDIEDATAALKAEKEQQR